MPMPSRRLLRTRGDGLLVGAAAAQAGVLLAWPCWASIALGLWWGAQTVAHNSIHRPLFLVVALDRAFALLLTLLLGFPMSVWRARHLAHHAEVGPPGRASLGATAARGQLAAEAFTLGALWTALLVLDPRFALLTYAPGIALGLTLCAMHGHYEHARGGTTSHYGKLYNWLTCNDGFHAEHHAHPGAPWWSLPRLRLAGAPASRWPAPLRFLELWPLNALERLVLWSPWLQRWVLRVHGRALRAVLEHQEPPARVAIVGGGLYPRTALLLRAMWPRACLTLIDAARGHLTLAEGLLRDARVETVHGWYDARVHQGFDLLVLPLAYAGDREAVYAAPPAKAVLVHDWVWRRRGASAIVSWLLLKRVNVVRRAGASEPAGKGAAVLSLAGGGR